MAGRPNKYYSHVQPRLIEIEAWSRKGLTLEQIAKNLGVGLSNLKKYQNQFQDLKDVLEKGRTVAVTEVENALFKRAIGYDYEETKTYLKKEEDGKTVKYVEKTTKHMPSDVAACIVILKNKDRGNWSNDPMKLDLEREKFKWLKEIEELKASW